MGAAQDEKKAGSAADVASSVQVRVLSPPPSSNQLENEARMSVRLQVVRLLRLGHILVQRHFRPSKRPGP